MDSYDDGSTWDAATSARHKAETDRLWAKYQARQHTSPAPILTEQMTDAWGDTYTQQWRCDVPPSGASYQVIRDEWTVGYTVRVIHEIRAAGGVMNDYEIIREHHHSHHTTARKAHHAHTRAGGKAAPVRKHKAPKKQGRPTKTQTQPMQRVAIPKTKTAPSKAHKHPSHVSTKANPKAKK